MKITRSYSRKLQIRQFEPIEFFCAAECEILDTKEMDAAIATSEMLDKFVQGEVEKSANIAVALKNERLEGGKKSQDVGLDDFGNDLQIETI